MAAGPGAGIRGRDAAGLWALALAASAAVGTHGIVYWDAGDYVRLALDGGRSGLLLGRPLFLLASRLILSTGVDAVHAEPVLRWLWCAVGATAAPAMAILASRLGQGRRASLIAGAALALSPSFAHTSHQVLTDAPALALSIAALASAARSQAVWSGLLLAAAILTRETAAVHVVALAILLGRRAGLGLAVLAATMALTLWVFPPAIAPWLQAMSQSADAHPLTAAAIGLSILWVLLAGPVPVIVGAFTLTRRPNGRWLVVSVPAAVATIALLFYPDGSFSPRYVLATAPLAFFLGAGVWFSARSRWWLATLVVPLAVVPIATQSARAIAARGAVVMTRVPNLPAGALVVPGHYCPQARLAASIHHRGDLDLVCPGWGWPADPASVLDAALASGRPVAVDLADDAWVGTREGSNRDAIHAWAAARPGHSIAGFFVVQR